MSFNVNPMSFLFRNKKEELRHGVECENRWEVEGENFYNNFKHVCKLIESWVGKKTFRMGFKPIEAVLKSQASDYNRMIGVGTFVNANKYNDIRGYLLSVVEVADETRNENNRLSEKVAVLESQVAEFKFQQIKVEFEEGVTDHSELFERLCTISHLTPEMMAWGRATFPDAYKKRYEPEGERCPECGVFLD